MAKDDMIPNSRKKAGVLVSAGIQEIVITLKEAQAFDPQNGELYEAFIQLFLRLDKVINFVLSD